MMKMKALLSFTLGALALVGVSAAQAALLGVVQPCLSAAVRTGQRDKSRAEQQAPDVSYFPLTPDETCQLYRKICKTHIEQD